MPKLSLRSSLLCLLYTVLMLLAGSAHADPVNQALPVVTDPVLEKHVMNLTQQLRCLVCQNQTIADSQAQLAIDLKNQVREKLAQGASDKDVIGFMVERYGDFVLYRPPLKQTTWLLWFGPFLLLVFGLIFLFVKLRQRRTPIDLLPAADIARAAALLAEKPSAKELS